MSQRIYRRHDITDISYLRPWSREIPEIFNEIEGGTCECGKDGFTARRPARGLREHLDDVKLWERDHYFEIAKPPLLLTTGNIPVEYASSGYKVQEIDEKITRK